MVVPSLAATLACCCPGPTCTSANCSSSTGAWDEALVHAHIALSLLAEEQRSWVEAHAHEVMGCVLASRGEWEAADDHLVAARQAADELGTAEAEMTSRTGRAAWAKPVTSPAAWSPSWGDAGIGNQDGVPTLGGLTQARRVGVGIRWWPVLIEALISLGEFDVAATQLARCARCGPAWLGLRRPAHGGGGAAHAGCRPT